MDNHALNENIEGNIYRMNGNSETISFDTRVMILKEFKLKCRKFSQLKNNTHCLIN